MRLASVALAGLLVLGSASAHAQSRAEASPAQEAPNVDALFAVGSSEWMVSAGPAFGDSIFHSSRDHKYVLSSLSWGRVLSKPVGPGFLRGRFEWAVEFVPLFRQYTPTSTTGIGLTPLTWRWNFDSHGRIAPYAELAGGFLWSRESVPPDTTTRNFTAHASYGIRYFYRPRHAIVAGYTFHHISNGNRLEKNPGVNAHLIQFGFTVVRPR